MPPPNHSEIFERLGNLGGRMSALEHLVTEGFRDIKETISEGFGGVKEVTDRHEERIRDLEISQGTAKGGLKTIMWVGGAMGTVIGIAISIAQWVLG